MISPIDYWKFQNEFTVIEVSLLIIGANPADHKDIDEYNCSNEFHAVFSAIKKAITGKNLNAKIICPAERVPWGHDRESEEYFYSPHPSYNSGVDIKYYKKPDWNLTTVKADDLRAWLLGLNFKPAFFFSETTSEPGYLNKDHSRYSVKLAATVKVWLAMDDDNLLAGKATKAAITGWLESNYKELGLTHKGNMNQTGVDECTNVANWNDKGGATKTPIS